MNRLSYFKPYDSKQAHHEDHLTRAYLVVLRFVPAAFGCFLDLVRAQQIAQGFEYKDCVPFAFEIDPNAVTLETQVNTPSKSNPRWLSLLITDSPPKKSYTAKWVDRDPRYDAVVSFGNWTLIAENKPRLEDVWPDQLCPRLPIDIEKPQLCKCVVVLEWPVIVEKLLNLTNSGHVHRAESLMIEDFLSFVDENFPHLNPYKRFSLCKTDLELVNRRCKQIMEVIAQELDSNMHYHHGFGNQLVLNQGIVSRAALYSSKEAHEKGQIWLGLWPADTVNQAREFYRRVKLDALTELIQSPESLPGWRMETNFHFGFMQQNLYYPTWQNMDEGTAGLHLDSMGYMKYWQRHQKDIRQYSKAKSEIETLFQNLYNNALVSDEDIKHLRALYLETNRHHINLCPGMFFLYRWPRKNADNLDDLNEFVADVKKRLQEILNCWGQKL